MTGAIRDSVNTITVIVVTFNSSEVIGACLSSIGSHPDIQIVVVDNASTDDTVALIRSGYPNVQVLASPENSGFAKAVNAGMQSLNGSAVSCLVNPDAAVTAVALRGMARQLAELQAGIVAPLIMNEGGQQRVVPAGYMPTIWRMFTHYSGLSRLGHFSRTLQGHYLLQNQVGGRACKVEWVTGACMMFKKSTWDRVGGLSTRWFMYAEDIDFCYRVALLGSDILILPEHRATHLVGASDSTGSYKNNPAWVVNLRDFYTISIAKSRLGPILWSLVVGMGLLSRAAVFWAVGFATRSDGGRSRLADAARFAIYGSSVLRTAGKRS